MTGDDQPTLRVRQVGRLGNHMIQFLNAQSIVATVPEVHVCGYEMPLWNLRAPCGDEVEVDVELFGRHLPAQSAARLFRSGRITTAQLVSVALRQDLLGDVDAARNWFTPPSPPEILRFGGDALVISVRGDETLGDVHEDYGPLPIRFIQEVVVAERKNVVFLGQLGDDRYSELLRRAFPSALFEQSRGPLTDFETLRHSDHVVLALSTFSWLAAWLSHARTIHVPLTGFYHPRQRPDIDLLPMRDRRYRFYDVGVRRWASTEENWTDLALDRPVRRVTTGEVRLHKAAAALRTMVPRLVQAYDFRRRAASARP